MELKPSRGQSIAGWHFGKLFVECEFKKGKLVYARVRCDCGVVKEVGRSNLLNGSTSSCGCYRAEVSSARATSHGKTGTRPYRIWQSMLTRCYNEKYHEYYLYGGAGVTVCESWRSSFETFYADMGEPPSSMQLDRKDGKKGYSKENCHWVSSLENVRNRASTLWVVHEGVKMTLKELSILINVDYHALYYRYAKGYRGEALSQPSVIGGKHLAALQSEVTPTPVRASISKQQKAKP